MLQSPTVNYYIRILNYHQYLFLFVCFIMLLMLLLRTPTV